MEDEIRRLVRRAYEFGYFVGYKGHSEWAEWVRKRRDELYKAAGDLGAYEAVRDAYLRGRTAGAKKREEDIRRGLLVAGGREGSTQEEVPPGEMGEESAVEVEFTRFVETVGLLMPPDLLDSLRLMRPPRMLHLGDKE
ncbi:hypothetical protein [Thermococcus camini]|uniref:Uncharacterized protein n=1 Tax=Thermococcus camini TaxID=2016373 RepID=A0A7G2D4K2_9EURY|nr:hypothetical protein [Thermococcus camini]CAD5243433.1 conserved protein of unknown function [Thermococcus camini]